jgi:hypothetical protein
MKIRTSVVFAVVAALFFSSCLTAEYKEYKFELTGKNSGILTITYRNLISQKDDDELTVREEVQKDYDELINSYINGSSMETEYPEAKILSKKLFEENNQLCAEIVLEFDDISDVNLYKFDKKSPLMLSLGNSAYMGLMIENFFDSNGDLGPAYFPVVIWDNKEKNLELTTTITTPDEESVSLLNTWKKDETYQDQKF